MKKAETLKEVYHIFKPQNTITKETRELYVDIFQDSMRRFVFDLENLDNPRETYLIAGQTGNGKSSALNMLSINYPKINEMYDFKYVVGRKNFEYLDKIDVADVLFNIAYAIIADDEELFTEFTNSLEKMEKLFNEELEEKIANTTSEAGKAELTSNIGIGGSILGIFKAKVDFNTSYSLSDEAVKSATEFFKFKKQELIKIINDIILSYKIKYKKDLIVVVDDLEKREDINHLYINSENQHAQLPILNDLNLVKIITMPIHITRSRYIKFGELKEFGLKLKKNDGSPNQEDRDLLKEVILKRVKKRTLFTDEMIEKVIDMSGANMNQLIYLIHKGAMEAMLLETNRLEVDEIDKASRGLQRELSPFVMNQRTFLNQIKANNIAIDSDEDLNSLEKAISNNVVFAYFNGNTWFELNPICIKSLEFYNDKSSAN
ncbi:MAG: hypothetical protein QM493_09090 [Sulfurovum sp.]